MGTRTLSWPDPKGPEPDRGRALPRFREPAGRCRHPCRSRTAADHAGATGRIFMNTVLLTSDISTESDVVFVRQRARQIAALLEFDAHEQTRIATAVSEIVRNAYLYAGGGKTQFSLDDAAAGHFIIRISDRGQGIPNLAAILAGNYKSGTGMGLGLLGARKLMDTFRVDSVPGHGTTVELGMTLP